MLKESYSTAEEFTNACLFLERCVGTLRSGCSLDEVDSLYLDTLYRLCREYVDRWIAH